MSERNSSAGEPTISWLNEQFLTHAFWFYLSFYLYTLLVWALLMLEFFAKAKMATLPGDLMAIYLVFLAGFTGQGELARWRLRSITKRPWSEIWAYTWVLSGIIVYGVNGFFPDLKVPGELKYILYTVVVYFTGSVYSRKAYQVKHPPEKSA